jgi:hypothetical protein
VKSPFPLPGTHKKIEKRKEGKFTSTPVIASYLSILFFVIFLFGRLKNISLLSMMIFLDILRKNYDKSNNSTVYC